MADLVAPLSKYKKKTFLIWMGLCIVFGAWFFYDGYFNEKYISKHTTADGKPDGDLVFNRKAPIALIVVVAFLGGYLFVIRNKKVVADETGLVIDDKVSIAYDAIQKIDKTHFDAKGRFTITYQGQDGKEIDLEISDRNYDNLKAILDHLISKIS
jgi:hypothetical protein